MRTPHVIRRLAPVATPFLLVALVGTVTTGCGARSGADATETLRALSMGVDMGPIEAEARGYVEEMTLTFESAAPGTQLDALEVWIETNREALTANALLVAERLDTFDGMDRVRYENAFGDYMGTAAFAWSAAESTYLEANPDDEARLRAILSMLAPAE